VALDQHAAANRLRRQLDESLKVAVLDACEVALALARLDDSLTKVAAAIDHPALTIESRAHPAGHTRTVRLLGRVVMRWSFSEDRVDLYCRTAPGATSHLRLRYAPHAREWRTSMPGSRLFVGSFDDEDAKVLEILEDALAGATPWVGANSLTE
jgi:hypothetical protein